MVRKQPKYAWRHRAFHFAVLAIQDELWYDTLRCDAVQAKSTYITGGILSFIRDSANCHGTDRETCCEREVGYDHPPLTIFSGVRRRPDSGVE